MAVDYSDYQSLYNYMGSLLKQIQSVSGYTGRPYTGHITSGESFSEVYKSTLESASQKQSSSLGVPESMDAIFEEAARQYNVPVNLLKAVGKAESGFDANAVSPAGAQGVMQLMPSTAVALGVEDPFDARSNIMGGAKYISEKLNEYNGDIELALAAYNAGSGNVEKYGGVPPFAETINYIQKIKGYMGTDLTTGKTVESRSDSGTSAAEASQFLWNYNTLQGLEGVNVLQGIQNLSVFQGLQSLSLLQENQGFSTIQAMQNLSMLNLMRLQMQSRSNLLSLSLDGEESGNLF